ncbi:hypothetical protein D3C83_171360 [compost metagenome]
MASIVVVPVPPVMLTMPVEPKPSAAIGPALVMNTSPPVEVTRMPSESEPLVEIESMPT